MMPYTTLQALGQARLAELHHQAQDDALARAARRVSRQHSTHHPPGLWTALTRWARRRGSRRAAPRPTL